MNSLDEKWSKIDKLTLMSTCMSVEDECYFLLERSNGTYLDSFANNMINNFQKDPVLYAGRSDVLRYKNDAIAYFGEALYRLLDDSASESWVIIPLVTSIPKCEKDHDDRLLRASIFAANLSSGNIVVDDILDVKERLVKSKSGGSRDACYLQQKIIASEPAYKDAYNVVLVDDVLTSGAHFLACRNIVSSLYPNARFIGAFFARHVSRYEYEIDYEF